MKFQLECTYCGHIWNETAFNEKYLKGKCIRCNDRFIFVKNVTSTMDYYADPSKTKQTKIDYYEGSPAFPTKKIETNHDWPYLMMGGD